MMLAFLGIDANIVRAMVNNGTKVNLDIIST